MVDTGCVACQNTWEHDYTSKITQTPTVVGGDAKVCLSCPGSCDIAVSTGEPPDEVIEGRFRFGMGEWTESSEDNSSTESEAPAPRKKMKLSVRKEKDKENRWQFVFCFVFYLLMKRKSRHLGRSSYPRTPLLALNGP